VQETLLSSHLSMMMSKTVQSFHLLLSPPWKQQPAHGLYYHTVALVHSMHCPCASIGTIAHLNLSALAKRSRPKIPSPPFVFGRHVIGQFTIECPLYTLSGVSPLHIKLLRKRSIFLISHLCSRKAVMW
jgi:hypothetical protein